MFFRAFTQQQIDEMEKDHSLIDKLVEDEQHLVEGCVDTAWDLLRLVLDGAGITAGEFVDGVMFNGCFLMSADEVRHQADILSKWTHDEVLQGLRNVEEDAYHAEVYQEDEDDFIEKFDELVAFYREAADKGLAALSYNA